MNISLIALILSRNTQGHLLSMANTISWTDVTVRKVSMRHSLHNMLHSSGPLVAKLQSCRFRSFMNSVVHIGSEGLVCSVPHGDHVSWTNGSTLTIDSCAFIDIDGGSDQGAAVGYTSGSEVNVTKCSFLSCTTGSDGGAMHIKTNGEGSLIRVDCCCFVYGYDKELAS